MSDNGGADAAAPERMTGAQAIVRSLVREGVEVIFGLPGGANMPIYDAIYLEDRLRHYLVRHEQAAAMMAEGYACSTGRVGVCMATSGPGATNLVTGLADAHMDSVPLVAITGQVPTPMIGSDAFQESDVTGITMPVVKHSYLLRRAEDVPVVMREAFHIAGTGRPGPVVIDVPKDVQLNELDYEYPEQHELRGYHPTRRGHPRQVRQAVQIIDSAQRPVIYCGGGAIMADASAEALALAERIHAPVVASLMAKGVIPESHPLCLGMAGMHGSAYANWAMNECDVMIAVGTRFDDRVVGQVSEFAKLAAIIHIDIDPAEIGKVVRTAVPIVGDCKVVLQQLLEELSEQRHEAWVEQVDRWRSEHPLTYDEGDGVKAQYVLDCINEVAQGEAIIATDVGQHQMWAAQFCKVNHARHWLTSGGLGAMGFGMPAAIGAQVAHPDKLVFCVAGDGSIQMNIQDLITATSNQLPVIICVLNNQFLGMVRQWQGLFFGRRYSAVDLADNPDFVKLADAYGAYGRCIDQAEDVLPALQEAAERRDRPSLLDFRVNREDDVFPMIPSGKSVREMILDDAH